MSFINKFLFHFHDKSIHQLLVEKNYKEFLNHLKNQRNKENLFYDLMYSFNQKFFNANRNQRFLTNIPKAVIESTIIIIISFYFFALVER